MNYLAHIFLSGSYGKLQIGNFVGDAVKGTSYKQYPPAIAKGILLHRVIDDYTDNHPAIKATVQQLRPHFGRYAGILLDIYFDYFLASRFQLYSAVSLRSFAFHFYWSMICNRPYLPRRFKRFMWHFICTNRLCKYAKIDGIRDSLNIMVKYGRINIDVNAAITYLEEHEAELWTTFHSFFGDLQSQCCKTIAV